MRQLTLSRDWLYDANEIIRHDNISSLKSSERETGRNSCWKRATKGIGGPGINHNLQFVVHNGVQLLQVQDTVFWVVLGEHKGHVDISNLGE